MSKSDMLNIDYGDNIDKSSVDLSPKSKAKVQRFREKMKWQVKK
jgi:hypothetical protein